MNADRCTSIEGSIEVLSKSLNTHIGLFSNHEARVNERHLETQKASTMNTEAINNQASSIEELTNKIEGPVAAWESVTALVDAINALGQIAKWIGLMAGSVVAVAGVYKLFV